MYERVSPLMKYVHLEQFYILISISPHKMKVYEGLHILIGSGEEHVVSFLSIVNGRAFH